jgi:HD-GYP domain-containing protein (c-di-GMP phosphodiesterase class II)
VQRLGLVHDELTADQLVPAVVLARLAGMGMSLSSRITFVADAIDAMTSDCAFRAGRPLAAALAEVRCCSGSRFDPTVVAVSESALLTDAARAA